MNTSNNARHLIVLSLSLAVVACSPAAANDTKPKLPPRPQKVATPLPARLSDAPGDSTAPRRLALTGQTRASRESAVATTTSGLVDRVLFRAGDFVKAGQVLVRIDPRTASLAVAQAEAALETAKTQAAGALRERKRLEQVGPRGAVPQVDVDRATTASQAAAAQVAQAEAALAMAKKNLSDTVIRAPFAGLVLSRNVDEGEWLNTMSNGVVARIADVDPLEIALQAPEHRLTDLADGDTMQVRFTATGQSVDAKVSRIVRAIDPRTRSFEVVLSVPNPERAYAPGLFAEASLLEGAKL
ncbi:MAG: efflux RND transporter periplasmic adaptor subunit [Deltaproteobacteria bacterium]|jgi:RND family efflux transporter MFP subunit